MATSSDALTFLLLVFGGRVNRGQQKVIDYLLEENRVLLSARSECLDKIVPLGERHLRETLKSFVEHYHRERHHQGLGGQLIEPNPREAGATGPVKCRQRLGGLLSFYYRDAA